MSNRLKEACDKLAKDMIEAGEEYLGTASSTELTKLRTSLRRIAQATHDPDVIAAIPEGDEFNRLPYAERGWNRLAAFLCGWVEAHVEQRKTLTADEMMGVGKYDPEPYPTTER